MKIKNEKENEGISPRSNSHKTLSSSKNKTKKNQMELSFQIIK